MDIINLYFYRAMQHAVNSEPEQAFQFLIFLKTQNDYWNISKKNILYGN
jgi:hypothetical protein